MIIYTCPKCGGDIYHTCICTMPPIDVYDCYDCDWHYEEPKVIDKMPFTQKGKAEYTEEWKIEASDIIKT